MPAASSDEVQGAKSRTLAAEVIIRGLKGSLRLRHAGALQYRRVRSGSLTFHQQGGIGSRTFVIGDKLGEGGYSTIWRVYEKQPDGNHQAYAVKRVLIDGADVEQNDMVDREVGVMEGLPPHPNILALIGSCRKRKNQAGRGRLDEMFLLLELCRGGNLATLIMQRAEQGRPFAPKQAAALFLDMVRAVAHLHAQPEPLAHRDIKPENYLLNDLDGRWKLADFGSTTVHGFDYSTSGAQAAAAEEDRVHRLSTPQYRAPEMCDVRSQLISHAVDVWALGVCLYKVLFLRDLFGVCHIIHPPGPKGGFK